MHACLNGTASLAHTARIVRAMPTPLQACVKHLDFHESSVYVLLPSVYKLVVTSFTDLVESS